MSYPLALRPLVRTVDYVWTAPTDFCPGQVARFTPIEGLDEEHRLDVLEPGGQYRFVQTCSTQTRDDLIPVLLIAGLTVEVAPTGSPL